MTKLLSENEVAGYRARGYHFPVNALSESEVAEFRGKLEDYEARTGGPIQGEMRHRSHVLFPWINEMIRHPRILDAIEDLLGVPVHPLRFRANLYVTGWPAWREFDLVGQKIAIGKDARLKIVKRIVRCAATDVDPETGIRDLSIPPTLMRSLGHADCGVYGEVVNGGDIVLGDELRN